MHEDNSLDVIGACTMIIFELGSLSIIIYGFEVFLCVLTRARLPIVKKTACLNLSPILSSV